MVITKETIEYVANLARIELSPEELDRFSRQLEDILDFIDKLKKLDTSHTSPTSHILPINNVLRQDSPKPSLPVEKVLANAPSKDGNFFVVPKVIE
jgi:aspartyl-tRNA(Asn)/glutamyl-tRNA(Gln) amidotransferase subunit C